MCAQYLNLIKLLTKKFSKPEDLKNGYFGFPQHMNLDLPIHVCGTTIEYQRIVNR